MAGPGVEPAAQHPDLGHGVGELRDDEFCHEQ